MKINADFLQRAQVDTLKTPWLDSPQPGVQRILLDRVGGEVARATTLVRFVAGSCFPVHEHGGGEEILVLEGVFSDETGNYAAGSYMRNPPGSRHTPYSLEGCVILVKLWQFAPDDQQLVRVAAGSQPWQSISSSCQEVPLYHHGLEGVRLLRYQTTDAPEEHPMDYPQGMELLVLKGRLSDGQQSFSAGTWVRWPPNSRVQLRSVAAQSMIYQKYGHLNQITCWDIRSEA